MVAEACQESGTLYTGNTYNGYGDIYHKELSSSPYVSLCDITPPWTGTAIEDELLTEDVPKAYSSGSEYYVITMHDAFGGETNSAEFTECWYTEDGNRYVKLSGADTGTGTTWTAAWATVGYGFQNIPSGKDLYVECGLYGSETLSYINPINSNSVAMNVVTYDHQDAESSIVVTNDSVVTNFVLGGAPLNAITITWMQLTGFATTHTLYSWDIKIAHIAYSGNMKLKVFREVGDDYVYVGTIGQWAVDAAAYEEVTLMIPGGFDVQSGDLLAIIGDDSTGRIGFKSGGANLIWFYLGDIESTTAKTNWSEGSWSYDLGVVTHGV